jgi:excisionase family DNA binding protein
MISRDSLLTPEIVASLLGVTRRTIYNMVSAGEIPGAVHLGRRLRFNSGAIRAWLRILRRNGRRGVT